MKYLYKTSCAILTLGALLCGCSDKTAGEEGDPVEVKAAGVELDGVMNASGVLTRATVDGYSVNTANDPTLAMDTRSGWELYVDIKKSGDYSYAHGTSTFSFSATPAPGRWVPDGPIYFPNYTRQQVEAKLYPVSADAPVSVIQNTGTDLLNQDILVQNGDNYVIAPAHIPTIRMRHANSMVDFVINEVDTTEIASVGVYVGNTPYYPYRVQDVDEMEYLVIFPVGTVNPRIVVTTMEGAVYHRTLEIDGTTVNTCYCATLSGLELKLSAISVTNWIYGEAIEGNFSAVTSYPALQAPPNSTMILHYDNKLTQEILFNESGESTVKPRGRTVVKIEYEGNEYPIDPPLHLRNMVIDLTGYVTAP